MTQIIPFSNTPVFLTSVVPSSSTVSTADELSRFAEILRRGGELDGVRVMRPETLAAAIRPCRRLRPDVATGLAPIRWGTGFMLGSKRFGPFGTDAAAAFGHTGLTNVAIWADPARGLAAGSDQQRQTRATSGSRSLHRTAEPDHRADTSRVNCRSSRPRLAWRLWVTHCCSTNSTKFGRCCTGRGNSSGPTRSCRRR